MNSSGLGQQEEPKKPIILEAKIEVIVKNGKDFRLFCNFCGGTLSPENPGVLKNPNNLVICFNCTNHITKELALEKLKS